MMFQQVTAEILRIDNMKEPHSNEKKTSLTLSQINIISQTKFKSKQENISHAMDILSWFVFKFMSNLNSNQGAIFYMYIGQCGPIQLLRPSMRRSFAPLECKHTRFCVNGPNFNSAFKQNERTE